MTDTNMNTCGIDVFETEFFNSRLTYVNGNLVGVSTGEELPYEDDYPPQEELDKFW